MQIQREPCIMNN